MPSTSWARKGKKPRKPPVCKSKKTPKNAQPVFKVRIEEFLTDTHKRTYIWITAIDPKTNKEQFHELSPHPTNVSRAWYRPPTNLAEGLFFAEVELTTHNASVTITFTPTDETPESKTIQVGSITPPP